MQPTSSTSGSDSAPDSAEHPHGEGPALTAASWSYVVIITVVLVAGSFVALNCLLDPMGLFHSKTRLMVYTNERWSKYLLSIRYVPEHFDAVLVGTSVTDNWNTGLMQPLKTYNLSLEGGNISEERLLLENVLKRRTPKIVIFCIHPYLTASNGRKTPHLTRSDYWSALGSLELLRTYRRRRVLDRRDERRRVEQQVSQQEFNEFGQKSFKIPEGPWQARAFAAREWYPVDERSLAEYGQLVSSARAAGSRVVAVVPPVSAEHWVYAADAYRQYQRRILTFFHNDELLIDFNTPPYDTLRRDRRNFPDGVHLSNAAADTIVRELAQIVRK